MHLDGHCRYIGKASTYYMLRNVDADVDPLLSPTVPLAVYVAVLRVLIYRDSGCYLEPRGAFEQAINKCLL